MLTRWGYPTIRKVLLGTLLLCMAAALFAASVFPAVLLLSFLLLAFTFYFFRDPERKIPDEPGIIIAPADGRILLVQPAENDFTGPSSTLVSIFMSPFNVHVNRIPLDGRITRLCYHPGMFMLAFDHRSLEYNEKMEIGITGQKVKLLFSQVSGFLARRIVCELQEGDKVTQGSRFGMIRFGSRVDIVLPVHASVTVRPGERIRAGETVIARY